MVRLPRGSAVKDDYIHTHSRRKQGQTNDFSPRPHLGIMFTLMRECDRIQPRWQLL